MRSTHAALEEDGSRRQDARGRAGGGHDAGLRHGEARTRGQEDQPCSPERGQPPPVVSQPEAATQRHHGDAREELVRPAEGRVVELRRRQVEHRVAGQRGDHPGAGHRTERQEPRSLRQRSEDEQQARQQQRQHDVELLLDRERPVLLEGVGPLGREVVVRLRDEEPVLRPDRRGPTGRHPVVDEGLEDEVGGHGRDRQDQEREREDAAAAATVELDEDVPRGSVRRQPVPQDAGDQESREDEEDVDADVAGVDDPGVEQEDEHHRQCTELGQARAILEPGFVHRRQFSTGTTGDVEGRWGRAQRVARRHVE